MAQRVKPCVSCHGEEGRATADGYYPRIAGKPSGYLLHQLESFRDGTRSNAAMMYLLRGMPNRYLQEFAEYFASQHPPYAASAPPNPDAALIAKGKALVLSGDLARGVPACTDCHGADLLGRGPDIPSLLGVPQTYLSSQLGAWRVGLRHAKGPDCMAQIAQRLDPSEASAAAAWIATQVPSANSEDGRNGEQPRKLPLDCGSVNLQERKP